MTQTINLNSGNLKDIERRLYALEHASPLNNAAIGRSGLLVYDGGVITIENGGLDVTGTATVSGTLNVSGDTRLTGTTDIWGPLIVTGDTDLDGVTTITGTLSVEGDTTLKSDLTVTTGKIKAGDMTIDPASAGGSVKFDNGASLSSTGLSIRIANSDGTGSVSAAAGSVILDADSASMILAAGSARVVGHMQITETLAVEGIGEAPAGATPNLYYDPADKTIKVIA